MKFSVVLLLCYLLACGCTETVAKTDVANEGLHGAVKTLREYNYPPGSHINLPDKKDADRYYVTQFDKGGSITERASFGPTREATLRTVCYRFGNYRIDSTFDIDGHFYSTTRHDYNSDGFETLTTNNNPYDSRQYHESYTYDDKNHLLERVSYTDDNRLIEKHTYTYDDSGRKAEQKEYPSNGKLEGYARYRYDGKGQMIKEYYYEPSGKLMNETTYGYDNLGNRTNYASYNTERDTTIHAITKYDYDTKGNWTRMQNADASFYGWVVVRELEYY